MTTADPNLVMDALMKAVRKLVPDPAVQIDQVSIENVDTDGNFMVNGNMQVLGFWTGEQLGDLEDNQAQTYQSSQPVALLCGAVNLKGSKDERTDALKLVASVRKIAGTRLVLEGGAMLPPIKLTGVSLYQFDKNATVYEVDIAIEPIVQFGG